MTPDNQKPEPVDFLADHSASGHDLPAREAGRPFHDQLAGNASNDKALDDDFNADDFEYVRINGVVRAIPKASVADEPETATQAVPKSATVEVVDPHFYVWLADGNVIRVKQSDLPATAGTNAAFGHWQIENKVFQIVIVVPVEDLVKGDQK
jgi:hypothetical protein